MKRALYIQIRNITVVTYSRFKIALFRLCVNFFILCTSTLIQNSLIIDCPPLCSALFQGKHFGGVFGHNFRENEYECFLAKH